jgi:formylglycine-generating enzyme required for sulfatase activity
LPFPPENRLIKSKNKSVKNISRTISIGLGALALWASMAAQGAVPVITNITMFGATPRFGVNSDLGITNQVQYCTNLSQSNWVVLTNQLVAQSPYWFVDVAAPPASQRFYRVLALGTNSTPPDGMALIPAGSFTMGNCMDPSEGYSDELPLHTVYVSAFYMDKYPVTKSLWDTVKAWNGGNGYSYDYAGSGKASTHPVQEIDWYDCVKWCNARSQKEGLTPAYYTDSGLTVVYKSGQVAPYVRWGANGYRLPTEAEWEKAARGGASGQRFPWGNTISWSQANYYASPLSAGGYAYDVNPTNGYHPAFNVGVYPYTSPVGYFGANGYGLYDMAGNVWQWCWDWYGAYSSGAQTDPRGPASGSNRVDRGGGWNNHAIYCRAALRNGYNPTYSAYNMGFRSVLPAGQ